MKFRRYLLYTSFFSCLQAVAQPNKEGVTVSKEFNVSEIPEKWKNESAVIIAQKTEYQFNRVASGKRYTTFVRINEYIHKRIKLQDKNSLDEFSTFYYVTMGKGGTAEYQVIKSGGKTIPIDMKSAIEEESDIPAIYRPIYYRLGIKYFKIAIPDLEIGDIIDYNIHSTIDWDMKENGIEFTPFIFSLSNKYPTLHQEYRFVMVDGMKVRFRAYNGASNLKLDAKASVFGETQSFVAYYLLDKDREKSIEERWNYDLRSTPSVKFRVIMLVDNDTESKALGMASVDRSFLDFDAMYNRFVGAALYRTTTVNSLVAYTTEYIRKKREENVLKNDAEIVREVYYCLRKVFLEIYYKGPVHSELEKYMTGKKLYKKVLKAEKKDETQKEEKEDEVRITNVIFATALRMALGAQGIQSELYVYLPRSLGAWRDALFLDELEFVMKIRIKNRNYFLEAFNNFDAFATPYSYLEGVEGYSIGYDEKNKYYRTPGPYTSYLENVDKEEHTISFPSNMESVNVERTSFLSGTEKTSKVGIANLDRSYLARDFSKYYSLPEPKGKKKKEEEVIDMESTTGYNDPDKEERIKERKELFEKDLKAEFDLDKYEDFELLNDGRFGDTAILQFREKYSIKKMLSRAGKNYVFDIGKFLGSQIKLEQRELETRQSDIYLPNARLIENIIILNIPAGYTIDGLKELEMNIDNESGSFISTARSEGSKLTVTTRKIYKKNFDKKELWPNYIAFLEAAYKFSQLRVVLKKA